MLAPRRTRSSVAGVCIEVREGDGVEDVLARFRRAMSDRLGRRVAG
jgi:hypothetical protein